MEEIEQEVDLCVVCCTKIKFKKDPRNNNNIKLLSNNLIAFYLVSKVLKVNDSTLKKNLVNCGNGNPVDWIRLCDNCNELTKQAEELHQKLKRTERELNCAEQVIRDKARISINSEVDRKLVEETIDLTKNSGQAWRRIRGHFANKCSSNKSSSAAESESFSNPFGEGDKLANYLVTQNVSTANKQCEQNEEDEATSIRWSSPLRIKTEPQLPETLEQRGENYENLLINNLLEELEDDKAEFNDQDDKLDWHWEPDDKAEDDDDDDQVDLKEPDTGTSRKRVRARGSGKRKKVNRLKKVKEKGPLSLSSQKRRSTCVKKGGLLRTEDGKIKCRQCEQIFASASGLNSHEREKHSKTPGAFICDLCDRAFNSRDYLWKHKQQSHKLQADGTPKMISGTRGGAFICDLCDRAFNSRDILRRHKAKSHKVKLDGTPIPPKAPKSLEKDKVTCDLCGGKGFKSATELRKHVGFVHEKRFNFKCPLCGLGCRSMYSLKKHQLAVHPEEPSTKKLIETEEGLGLWECPVIDCKMRFLREQSVKGHLKSFHGRDDELVEGLDLSAEAVGEVEDPSLNLNCQTCGKIFDNKCRLWNHEKLVHQKKKRKGKDFICEICGDGYVSKEDRKTHVDKVHLKKGLPGKGRDFKCQVCGKAYAHKYMLTRHMEIHAREGKRDFCCDKCAHGFVTEWHLKKHKRVTNCGVEGKMARVYKRKVG